MVFCAIIVIVHIFFITYVTNLIKQKLISNSNIKLNNLTFKIMNKSKLFISLFAFLVSLTFIQCTSEDPIPGPQGQDGTDGIDGTTTCVACHSTSHREPIEAAFDESVHNLGVLNSDGTRSKHIYGTNTVFSDGSLNSNRAFCSECHSQEGYKDAVEYGKPNPNGYAMYQSISCEGCHGTSHRSFDFATDGNDYGLRQVHAVKQKITPTNYLNASATGATSTSNTCLSCHQARPDSNGYYKRPVIESNEKDFAGNVVINNTTSGLTYKFWSKRTLALAVSPYPAGTTNYKAYSNTGTGVHASTQGDLWMGITGIDIEGTTTHLPAAKTGAHYKFASCSSCHMDTPKTDGTGGSHTFDVSFNSCKACHTNPESLYTSLETEYDTKIEQLRLALSAKTAYFTTSSSGSISIKTTFPASISSSTNTTTWDVSTDFPLKYVQAYWNYKVLSGDLSKGVHNPLYVKALIQNSIEALQ